MDFYAPRARTHNEEEYQELLKQVQSLQNKLSAKTETLLRLGNDLETREKERDQWRAKAENYERNLERSERQITQLTQGIRDTALKDLEESRALAKRLEIENEHLKRQNDDLKAEIRDLQKDCKTFRQQLARVEVERIEERRGGGQNDANPQMRTKSRSSSDHLPCDGETIARLEKLIAENKQLEADMSSLLGTKEELVLEREAMAKKIERLSAELTYLLNGDPRRMVEDLDSLMAENRYLKAQLDSANEESQTIKETLEKYRTVAEHVHARKQAELSPSVKESKDEEKSTVAVVNMKQIRELLTSHSIELDEGDYRAMSNILLDVCNDKQMALAHQRRANKILGNRLHEVEQKLQTLELRGDKSPRSVSPRL
ncbi:unnamed protein product, partial [Mesorhabditis belari]|uniref:Uncharacterized protein n=1 Tax=Mesorhabditis belari TaxID=2138241 RepID=A0AAF3ES90_9BILA